MKAGPRRAASLGVLHCCGSAVLLLSLLALTAPNVTDPVMGAGGTRRHLGAWENH